MKTVAFKIFVVCCAAALAGMFAVRTSSKAKAGPTVIVVVISEPIDSPGCYGSGNCGTTAGGTHLEGKWREPR